MKIAMFGHKRIPSREGGVEIVVEELSARISGYGHEVVCYNRSGHHVGGMDFDTDSVNSHRGVTIRSVWTLDKKGLAAVSSSFFSAMCTILNKYDVVHIHAEGPAFMCWLPKLFGRRVVVTVHGLDWQRDKWKRGFGAFYIRAGERMAVRFADSIIVLSRNIQQYFMDTYNRETVLIPNGVITAVPRPAQEISARYGLCEDGYILFLGRLVPEKGIHYLLEAFKNVTTNKNLVIAGSSSDTDGYVERLKSLAEGDDRVIFTGFVQGEILAELYSNAYVYVLPSDVEGMPLSLLEAMSYGNCCVTSDIQECASVTEDYGLTFPKGDTVALERLLQRLCDSPEEVKKYQEASTTYITGKYCWDDVAMRTLEVYR